MEGPEFDERVTYDDDELPHPPVEPPTQVADRAIPVAESRYRQLVRASLRADRLERALLGVWMLTIAFWLGISYVATGALNRERRAR